MSTNPSSTVPANWRYVLLVCVTGLLLFRGAAFTGHSEQGMVDEVVSQHAQPQASHRFSVTDGNLTRIIFTVCLPYRRREITLAQSVIHGPRGKLSAWW